MKTIKYIVSQTFETLGHASKSEHTTLESAESALENLRVEIAQMVADMETPSYTSKPTGYSHEIAAWNAAEKLAGVSYDDGGERTAGSPSKWGAKAGEYIADQSVSIEEVD